MITKIIGYEKHPSFEKNKSEILDAVRAVVDTMRAYVSAAEMDQALATLPLKIQEIFEASDL